MALKIYSSASPSAFFSIEGDMSNPIRESFDGAVGNITERQYWVRNDSSAFVYTDIEVQLVDTTGAGIVNGTNGFWIKMKAGNTQPNSAEWENIEAGESIDLADIGTLSPNVASTSTYLPFWVQYSVPRGAEVETYDDVVFRIVSEQTAV